MFVCRADLGDDRSYEKMTAMSGMTEIYLFGEGVQFHRDSLSSFTFPFENDSFALIMLK